MASVDEQGDLAGHAPSATTASTTTDITSTTGITVLKPLHGSEDGLYDNLCSFATQSCDGPLQLLFGVAAFDDAAVPVVRRLQQQFPALNIELVVTGRAQAGNAKIANLVGMSKLIRHELIVMSDSDIRVEPGYLRRNAVLLAQPGMGLVTWLYRGQSGGQSGRQSAGQSGGRSAEQRAGETGGRSGRQLGREGGGEAAEGKRSGGLWARLSAMAIDYHFVPSVLMGLRLGMARPCVGATMAFSSHTLAAIGGFEAFANHLADDYAIGEAVRRTGLQVVVAPEVVIHRCLEPDARDLLQHELRWARTIRAVDPAGFIGSFVMHPLPFALLGAVLRRFDAVGLLSLSAALGCRWALQWQVDRGHGEQAGYSLKRMLLTPMRDILSFGIFCASFLMNAVVWRGHRYVVHRDGTMSELKSQRS